jgi:hypothetical protein
MILPTEIDRDFGLLAAIVGADRGHAELQVLAVYGVFTVTAGGIDPDPELPVFAEPAGRVTGGIALRLILVADRQPVEIDIGGALGHEVELAANAAAPRSSAVEKGIGTAKHFEPLQELRRNILSRQEPIQPVVGNIVRVHREPANDIQLLKVTKAASHPDPWIVQYDVGDAGTDPQAQTSD